MVSVASPSVARAVTPTAVPLAADSETLLPVALLSLTALIENSVLSSVRLIVKPAVLVDVSLEVARTVMLWLVVVS